MLNKKIRKAIEVPIEFIVFLLAYYLFFSEIYKLRRRENLVGFGHLWFNDNIKFLYRELKKYDFLKVYFVTQNKAELERLRSYNINVYYYKDPRNIPLFLGTKIWVTSSGHSYIPFARAQIILRRFFGIQVSKWVDVWHGLVFKLVNRGKMLRNYDLGFVTSEFFKQYYSRESGTPHKLKITGYPRTDPLIRKNWDKKEILKEIKIPFRKKNILYAPTYGHYHKDFLVRSIERNLKDVEEFCKRNNSNFLIRMHPSWYRINPEKTGKLIRKIKESKHLFDLSVERYDDVQRILYITDVLITDWSSIANDFILLHRPIIFIDTKLPEKELVLKPEDRAGYIVGDKQEFFEKLQESLYSPNLFEKKRKMTIKKLYKHLDGKSSERCAKEIIRLLKNPF